MDQLLKGQVAVVTGGGSGIGRAAAGKLAELGAKICLLDRVEETNDKVQDRIAERGGEAIAVETDVSDAASVEHGIRQAVERWGRIDVVFANAGINGTWTPIEDLSPEDWDQTLSINLRGTFLTVKYAIPYMKRQGGSIIVTSSVNGTRIFSNTGASAYSSSKAGQVAFTKMAALELAQHQIRVNAICPGAIRTNIGQNTNRTAEAEEAKIPVIFPEGSMPLQDGPGSPEQVAELVAFLASPRSSLITGSVIYIDGAESLLIG
ncbi:SDR family NAD(P)-dependent oxidoreductase [Cohnella sp. REN36]|uniref:SDR family oxidoreductase n=1 Tax=Cohnella sp. REN36 TaxID=2887347 RepID=UPI001D146965|nr:SDR family NAD(P)-dependent oxidoreductase [Cohnella sp. REN36]MCC3374023.1 SDR family oxidoreductase [Cohnella sp. REN36]